MKESDFFSLLNELTDEAQNTAGKNNTNADHKVPNTLLDLNITAGEGHIYESERVSYRYYHFPEVREETILINNSPDCLQLIFCLKGVCSCFEGEHQAKEKPFYRLLSGKGNLSYTRSGEMVISQEGNGPWEMFTVNLQLGMAGRHINLLDGNLEKFLGEIRIKQKAILDESGIPIGAAATAVLQALIKRQYSGCFLQHYVELKTTELLILLLDEHQKSQMDNERGSTPLTGKKLEQMNRARDILIQNMVSPPTIKDLAVMIGTNEFHLKKQFKEVFGKTVYGYLHDYRMTIARQMLDQGDMKIAEISEAVGYKHATHFTTAFKKTYGVLPNVIKQKD